MLTQCQVPTLILDGPITTSLREVNLWFFRTLDNLLGSNFFEVYGRKGLATTSEMANSFTRISEIYNIQYIKIKGADFCICPGCGTILSFEQDNCGVCGKSRPVLEDSSEFESKLIYITKEKL